MKSKETKKRGHLVQLESLLARLVKWSRTSYRECYFHCNQSLIDTFLSLSRATPFLKDFLCLPHLLDLSQLFKECNQQRAMSSNFVVHPVVLEFVEEESALE